MRYLAREAHAPEIVAVENEHAQAYLDADHGWRDASDEEIHTWRNSDVYGGLQGPPVAAPLPPARHVEPPSRPHPTRYDATPAEGQHRDSNRMLAEHEAEAAGIDAPHRSATDRVGRQTSGVQESDEDQGSGSMSHTGQETRPPDAKKATKDNAKEAKDDEHHG